MTTGIVEFYLGKNPNDEGYKIYDIWKFDDEKLEKEHHYIQWMFPTNQKSYWNRNAPVLTDEDILMFKKNTLCMKNLRKSLRIIFKFYGFQLSGNNVVLAEDFETRKRKWITPNNHNFKRLSRILETLTIFGFNQTKKSLQELLTEIYNSNKFMIGDKTHKIWQSI